MTATKTGEYSGKKAGDKIVQMLSKEKVKSTKKTPSKKNVESLPTRKMTQQEINQRVNSILSGGTLN